MTVCGNPEKRRYTSRRAARRALIRLHRLNRAGHGRLHTYQCGDHWHIGH